MSKYIYHVFEVSEAVFCEKKIGNFFMGGTVSEGISGLDNEFLLIVAYRIEDEDA